MIIAKTTYDDVTEKIWGAANDEIISDEMKNLIISTGRSCFKGKCNLIRRQAGGVFLNPTDLEQIPNAEAFKQFIDPVLNTPNCNTELIQINCESNDMHEVMLAILDSVEKEKAVKVLSALTAVDAAKIMNKVEVEHEN